MFPLYEESAGSITVYRQNSRHISPHLHKSVEFVYLVSGKYALGVEQELYAMEAGDFAVIFPDLIHHGQVFLPGDNIACHVLAMPSLATAYVSELGSLCPDVPVIPASAVHPDIIYAMERLTEEFKDTRDARDEILASSFIHLILARSLPLLKLESKSSVESSDIIFRTVRYISSHFREPLSLPETAHDLGISRYTLSRVFSNSFHRNFNQFLNDERVNYAAALLIHTDRAVTDVCFDSGFESQRTFNRVFQDRYHMSPREYRNKNRPGMES